MTSIKLMIFFTLGIKLKVLFKPEQCIIRTNINSLFGNYYHSKFIHTRAFCVQLCKFEMQPPGVSHVSNFPYQQRVLHCMLYLC